MALGCIGCCIQDEDRLLLLALVDDKGTPIAWNGHEFISNDLSSEEDVLQAVRAGAQIYKIEYGGEIYVANYGYPNKFNAIIDPSL